MVEKFNAAESVEGRRADSNSRRRMTEIYPELLGPRVIRSGHPELLPDAVSREVLLQCIGLRRAECEKLARTRENFLGEPGLRRRATKSLDNLIGFWQ